MMKSILEQFLAEEAVPYVRNLICDAIEKHNRNPGDAQRHFEFNRFEVTLDYVKSTVLIEDVLDPKKSGEVSLSLKDFLCVLANDGGQVGP